ncbi:HlyD family secretion protein [Rugamonas sp. A1-17]|nr:HlyD family secretion protein [Rugamonas sp. A1-17]
MDKRPLFRTAALNSRQSKSFGKIILIRPFSSSVLVLFATLLASLVLAFMFFATYTQRIAVSGQLVSNLGLMKIFPPQPGIVLEKNIKEGQWVNKGDILYVLSSERQTKSQGNVQELISGKIEERKRSVNAELLKTVELQKKNLAATANRLDRMKSGLGALVRQIVLQKEKIKFTEDNVLRYQGLLTQGFVAAQQYQQKQMELLDQRYALEGLERDKMALQKDLDSAQEELDSQPYKQNNELSQIRRSYGSLEQELAESEAKRRIVITAPKAGIVTAVVAEVGQFLEGSRPLLSLIPDGAVLQAQLYAPSRAIGFVKEGDQVLLRYQAFAYQKFGQAQGYVASVSRVSISNTEMNLAGSQASPVNGSTEPFYLITVNLPSQTITAFGKKKKLQIGMFVDANIMQERRRIYEWVLEPLFTITGKM